MWKFIDLLDKDRFWLIDFINQIDKQKITNDIILFLDSIRCLFKFLGKKDRKLVCIQFERLMNNFYVISSQLRNHYYIAVSR